MAGVAVLFVLGYCLEDLAGAPRCGRVQPHGPSYKTVDLPYRADRFAPNVLHLLLELKPEPVSQHGFQLPDKSRQAGSRAKP